MVTLTAPGAVPDWNKMKVQELYDQLTSRGLDTTGVKSILIERLETAAGKVEDNAAATTAEAGGREDLDLDISEGAPSLDQVDDEKQAVFGEPITTDPPIVAEDMAAEALPVTSTPLPVEQVAEGRSAAAPPQIAAAPVISGTAVASSSDRGKKRRLAERFGLEVMVSQGEKRRLRAARPCGLGRCALLVVLGSLMLQSHATPWPVRIRDAPAPSLPLPFIVLHGIGDMCVNNGLAKFTLLLTEMSGATGFCIEIGNGASDSFFMRLDKQADDVCQQVKNIAELEHGYNMVGLSQGNVIGRAVIQYCDDGPPVNNFVSIGGPHAGIAAVPLCKVLLVCKLVDAVIRIGVYSSYVQNNLAPTGYVKIPTDLDAYYKGCLFLPRLNNELPESRNATYKQRFSSINHLALVRFGKDEVLFPPSTAWFGFYAPNDFSTLLTAEETDLYKEDWIGLKALNDSGRVTYITFPGSHLSFSEDEMRESIVPYLLPSFPSSVVVR